MKPGSILEEDNQAKGEHHKDCLDNERLMGGFLLKVSVMAGGVVEERRIHFRYFFWKGPWPFPKKELLAAFIKATEMTHHAAFLKADRLSAFRAFFSHEAVLAFVIFFGIFTG